MATLRKPDPALKEPLPPNAATRIGRLQDLVNLHLGGQNNVCLLYWKPDEKRWVVWEDAPLDPLPEAGVGIAT